MSIIKKTITTGLVGLLGLGLAACNNDDATPSANSEPAKKAAAADEPAKEEKPKAEEKKAEEKADDKAADSGSTGGAKWSVEVDGAAIEIADATVVCQEAAGTINIAIASTKEPDKMLGAQVTAGDSPTVQGVGLLDKDGNALAYAEGAGQGKAEAKKNGNVYEITGEGLVTDLTNPTAMETKPFSVTVDCG